VTTRLVDDEAIDNAAVRTFAEEYGGAATALPPLAIVVAAYNEEGAIGPVISALPDVVAGLDAAKIVVSDGAVDGTAKEASTAGAMVCEVPVNRGQGAALRLGYRLAREGGARYIVTTDADGQYNPAEIERLLTPLLAGEADFATGSRRLGSEESRDPVRRLGVRVFALAISALTGQRISDTTFGLRAMRAEVTAAVRLEQPQYQAAELLIGVITHGYRVVERPATIHKRTVGSSKKGNNVFYGLSFARVVFRTWWRERQRRVPGSAVRPAAPEPLAESADSASAAGSRPSAAAAAPGASANGASAEGASASGSGGTLDPRSTKRT
jgi:glycosyltransferase involved in cell wall biosynthesis